MTHDDLSPTQLFALELVTKHALSKMDDRILAKKKKDLETKKLCGTMEQLDVVELGFVNKELNYRLWATTFDIRLVLGTPLFFENPEFTFKMYDDILPGKFLVGLVESAGKEPHAYVPVMFSEHGLYASLEEIDARSPIRLIRRVNEWACRFPRLHRTLIPALADFRECAGNVDWFRDVCQQLLQRDRYFVAGLPIVDIRVSKKNENPEPA